MTSRTCSRCGETKLLDLFPKHRTICRECNKLRLKTYRQNNQQKIKEYNNKYKKEHSEQIKKSTQIYYELCRDKVKESQKKYRNTEHYKKTKKVHDKQYYDSHKDKLNERAHKYYEQNNERLRESIKEWKKKNKDKLCIYNNRERARKKGACVDGQKVTPQDIRDIFNQQAGKCYYCGKSLAKYHIDHYIPLSKNGKHIKENLRLACPKCNLIKGAKLPEKFEKQINKVA